MTGLTVLFPVMLWAALPGLHFCCTHRRQVGEPSKLAYRSVRGISAYVPLIYVRQLTDPLLAIDVKSLPVK